MKKDPKRDIDIDDDDRYIIRYSLFTYELIDIRTIVYRIRIITRTRGKCCVMRFRDSRLVIFRFYSFPFHALEEKININ